VFYLKLHQHLFQNFQQIEGRVLYRPFVASSATPWRQVISIPKVEVCGPLKFGSSFFVIQSMLKLFKDLFPMMMIECPQKVPYHFRAININYTEMQDDGTQWIKVPLANGIYRIQIKFTSDGDPDGFNIEWQSENKFINNINVFNKK
jgi:hypothetical protein